MRCWQSLPAVTLNPSAEVTAAFLTIGARSYRAAAAHVGELPYGRNSDIDDPLIVIREGRGTCSTKHALLRRLAIEQELEIRLFIGIYEMSGHNTPGVGPMLRHYSLAALPEAHCYLRVAEMRVDVTGIFRQSAGDAPIRILHEEEITPEQIGAHKRSMHRNYLRRWASEVGLRYTVDELWSIREECIGALRDASVKST